MEFNHLKQNNNNKLIFIKSIGKNNKKLQENEVKTKMNDKFQDFK